ncbi:MAG: Glycosyl transferase group 1 [Candidatus Magasanikbacteria bacterium GW2011_GWC2_37_14]|uniref:Glycosyl transferase group 1 n=1 Tax=Candidatus Magasanikbacteria bacterium GW2011_GWC2_37_14 TaxID=1619046 RepID=A0A0G0GNH2_9BACT|nr:MAG: Glycosyl transferase group 1 [Candidatus Magasanikbacteria bacterium GW2011_GWC2_37_14]
MIIGIDASRANEEQKTGVGWYAFWLIEELKKITPENIRVVLYTREPLKGQLADLPENWQEKVLGWWPKKYWTQIRLSWEMLFHRPDVLFIPAHVFPIIHPKKTVMTIHDIAAKRYPETYNKFERWYTVWSAKTALKKLWRVIVPSEFVRQELLCYFTARHEHKITVIKHGCHTELFEYDNLIDGQEILRFYGLNSDYLISLGRLEEKKNTIGVVKAFEQIKMSLREASKGDEAIPRDRHAPVVARDDSGLKLLLVGSPGFGYEKVKQAVEESPFKDDIIIPGWVKGKDLKVLLGSAKVLVFPSRYEGFGLPILEAFAAGVPVVAGQGSSLEEVGGEAVLYCNSGNIQEIADNVELFLNNPELTTEKINLGKERLKKFTWQKTAEETLALLLK